MLSVSKTVPSGFHARNGASTGANGPGMRSTLERIYIGRRFKNDAERLEKPFETYTAMTTEAGAQ